MLIYVEAVLSPLDLSWSVKRKEEDLSKDEHLLQTKTLSNIIF